MTASDPHSSPPPAAGPSVRPVSETAARDVPLAADGEAAAPVPAAHRHDPMRGAILMGTAMFLVVLLDTGAKLLIDTFPVAQIVFFRSAFALIPVGVLIVAGGGWKSVRIRHPFAHLLRAVCGMLAMFTFFTALRTMTLADTTAVAMAAPLFITALAIPALGERVGAHRWGALVVGMVGVIVMLRPSPTGLADPTVLLPLATAFFYGSVQVITRKYAHEETTQGFGLTFNVIVLLVTGTLCLPDWHPVAAADIPAVLLIGVAGGLSMIFMIMAYRAAEASFVSSFDYTALAWAALIGWLGFGELPDPMTIAGAVIMVSSGLYILRRETLHSSAAG